MNKILPPLDIQSLLQTVASEGLDALEPAELLMLAKATWHGSDLPQHQSLSGLYVQDAYRLLARLSAFPTVPIPRRRQISKVCKDVLGSSYLNIYPELEKVLRPHLPMLQTAQLAESA